jgi:hypothetical protein
MQADGQRDMRLMCNGGLGGVCAVWVWNGAVRATALAHAVVCRHRDLSRNQISTIANGTFSGLTALAGLYGAGLCGLPGLSLVLAAWCF